MWSLHENHSYLVSFSVFEKELKINLGWRNNNRLQIHIETAAPMFNGGPDEWVETDAQIFDAGHPNRMVHDLVQRLTDPDPHVSEIAALFGTFILSPWECSKSLHTFLDVYLH